MAQCKLTPREFIGNAFSPQIGAVCSSAADVACQKNNLTFIELLQPFCNLATEGHFKDPQGTSITVRNLRLSIQDIYGQPPEPMAARKMLNDSVTSEQCERTTTVQISNTDLEIPTGISWFEAWREMFLNVQFPSDHEFTKHFLACMVVVSTADENPLEKIQQMAAQLHQSPAGKLPKWFNNNALRYYVLIHDANHDDKSKAETVFSEMKNLYDANNCFLLQINSRPPGHTDENIHLPDPWSQFLAKHVEFTSDHSSPRTPADTGGVAAMPNEVSIGTEKIASQAGTPMAGNPPVLLSPDVSDKISLSSEILEPTSSVEMGQEAVSVTIHPLSPDSEKAFSSLEPEESQRNSAPSTGSPINANVWADSPSRPVTQHGTRLSTQDLDMIRALITEFCLKSLLPYVEKQIGLLTDVISNKKGVSRSLFSATKRWFGTSKPGAPGSTPTNAVIYTTESPELQLRRLADLCFMFGHYTVAYQAYHSAKRDFAADQAWLYYAGALEMAALSAFMQGEMTRKTIEYMDDAILTYSNSCKMPQFATRATLLSAECLKGKNLYGEAAKQLIRMTSEDSDLRSALLLEQAAYCFIASKMIHKYAFHAVLAGHRFSKSGQRKHSLRCYQQAYQVYHGKGWALAEDHIHFTIGRQAASLKHVEEAVRAFEKLLSPSSKQPAAQQAAFLREFLHIRNLLQAEAVSHFLGLPELPLPLTDGNEIKVLLGPLPQTSSDHLIVAGATFEDEDEEEDEPRWAKLEEIIVAEAQRSVPMIFKPTVVLYSSKSNNSVKPNAVVDEPIHFSIELYNPLRISIALTKIKLIWAFTHDGQTVSNETMTENSLAEANSVDASTVDALLQPLSRERIVLSCTPTQIGDLRILGISYCLLNPQASLDPPVVNPSVAIQGKRLFTVRGPKLKSAKERPNVSVFGPDYRLEMCVVDRAPFMQVSFSKIPAEMLCAEMQRVEMTLKNIGNAPLTNIHVGSSNPELFCVKSVQASDSKCHSAVTKISLSPTGVLGVGDTLKVPLWIRAPHEKGNHRLDLLFYYENALPKSVPRYRVCRHTWRLHVLNSLLIKAIVRPSAVTQDNSPTMNVIVQVKNSNLNNDSSLNQISIVNVALRNRTWRLSDTVQPCKCDIQPQETCHMLFKFCRKTQEHGIYSNVSLSPDVAGSVDSPYVDFVERQSIVSQDSADTFNHVQKMDSESSLARITRLGAILVLRWRARIADKSGTVRETVGQHHVALELVNKLYQQPEEPKPEPSEYSTRLKIFGPDRNVPDSTSVVQTDVVDEIELQKSAISFSLSHTREARHNFSRQQLCIVPVTLHLQNNLQCRVDVRVNTIGTSSQSYLPNVKSQLFSPQASTAFRYGCHTTICCDLKPFERRSVKLTAIISSPGTYSLASRLDLHAMVENCANFVAQKWRTESVYSVSDDTNEIV